MINSRMFEYQLINYSLGFWTLGYQINHIKHYWSLFWLCCLRHCVLFAMFTPETASSFINRSGSFLAIINFLSSTSNIVTNLLWSAISMIIEPLQNDIKPILSITKPLPIITNHCFHARPSIITIPNHPLTIINEHEALLLEIIKNCHWPLLTMISQFSTIIHPRRIIICSSFSNMFGHFQPIINLSSLIISTVAITSQWSLVITSQPAPSHH